MRQLSENFLPLVDLLLENPGDEEISKEVQKYLKSLQKILAKYQMLAGEELTAADLFLFFILQRLPTDLLAANQGSIGVWRRTLLAVPKFCFVLSELKLKQKRVSNLVQLTT